MGQEISSSINLPPEIGSVATRAINEAIESATRHSAEKGARIAQALRELHDPQHRLLHADCQELYPDSVNGLL